MTSGIGRPDRQATLRGGLAGGVWILAVVVVMALGCASGKPRKACLYFHASDNLNLYDGQPHPITAYVYPLSSSAAFEQTPVAELLEGAQPAGALGPAVPITLAPGEKRSFRETFPPATRQLGVLADYYRAPGDPEGTRTQVVPARCGFRKPKLTLSPKDIYPR